MRRRVLFLGLPAAAALLPTFSLPRASHARTRSSSPPIRLGQSAPVSGPLAQVGTAVREAALAVFADANAQGGIGGRDIQLVTLDDEDRAERTAVNVKLLASQHQVVGMFGFVGAGAHRAGARGAAEEGLPYIAAFSGSQELRSGAIPWVYNLRAGHIDEIEYIARHTRQVGIRRVSLVSEYNSHGWELRDALIASLESRGDNVASISSIDHEGSRYSLPGAVASVLAGDPQAIVLGADYVASARFVDAARRAGFTGLFYTLSTVGGNALTDMLGAQAAGLSVTQVAPFPWTASSPIGRNFQAFCARHTIEASFAGMEAYLGASLLVDALRRAREITPARLAEAIEGLPPRDFGGFVGAFYGKARKAPAQVDLTVFSRNGRFVK
ncbi:ABC transporter substrate-binding protein [Rhizobacter sp. J219]|uniref:ABC transporter substrate-binding protein n=1 Tax=Rhizobacter sp. J219 TaxID=2898430 RepID=UPI0021513176|nr:ABC transporter substrate-binding protein [Rhizobacter sp. J219]MCR5885674.1 ABC transporter substrate-binding protein [Rhizobacter sp. J219]